MAPLMREEKYCGETLKSSSNMSSKDVLLKRSARFCGVIMIGPSVLRDVGRVSARV